MALIGAAESGKSSVLRKIERSVDRLNPERQAVYLDLSQVSGDDDFYGFVCDRRGLRFVGGMG